MNKDRIESSSSKDGKPRSITASNSSNNNNNNIRRTEHERDDNKPIEEEEELNEDDKIFSINPVNFYRHLSASTTGANTAATAASTSPASHLSLSSNPFSKSSIESHDKNILIRSIASSNSTIIIGASFGRDSRVILWRFMGSSDTIDDISCLLYTSPSPRD